QYEPEAQAQAQPQAQYEPEAQAQAQPQAQYEPEAQAQAQPQAQYEPEPQERSYEPEPQSYEPAHVEPAHVEPELTHHEPELTHHEPEPAHAEPAPLGESVSETTLQVRLPDPPPEPDAHERAADVTAPAGHEEPWAPQTPAAPEPVTDQPVPGPRAPQGERLTDKGLPKRTPQVVRPAGSATTTPRQGGVDAEALRRRLGGFHQGAKAGRRDVEAEMETARTDDVRTARTEEMTGDTVEEARS
ncbi:histidine kinase, partial [Streptomyces sp. NPDC001930]